MNQHCHTLLNGITGTLASLMAVSTTYLTQLELWVRVIGGILGIVIALITLFNLIAAKLKKP